MSADNYYIILQDENSNYVPVMGFMSDPEDYIPTIRSNTPEKYRFESPMEAYDWAAEQYSEYGVKMSPQMVVDYMKQKETKQEQQNTTQQHNNNALNFLKKQSQKLTK